jgi:uncharacterized repeat protein (TIGR01451 family)
VSVVALFGGTAVQPALANPISVTTTRQGVTDPKNCSLQEAIQSANFHQPIAIDSTNPDHFYNTGCAPGSGNDIITLPDGAVLQMTSPQDDAHNPLGATATPIVFSTIIIEANGATLVATPDAPNMRAFAVSAASITTPIGVVSGTGKLTIRNAYIKGFHVKGGDGASGGGGGLGAGGAIYVDGSMGGGITELTIENSTLDGNGAVGGNGTFHANAGPGGGGGGLGGAGGGAEGDQTGLVEGGEGGGGGGGGSRGNGGANGGLTRTCVPVRPGCNGGWASNGGGGGVGTVTSGAASFSLQPVVPSVGGFDCGGRGGDFGDDGDDAPCPGGGGGGGGDPEWAVIRYGGDGGNGNYGGGGGGGGFHNSVVSYEIFGRQGGRGGFGGGGGAGGQGDNGGTGGFGGGGGAGGDTPGAGGVYGGAGSQNGGGAGAGLGGAIFSQFGNVIIRNSTFTNNYVSHGLAGGAGWGQDSGGAIFAVDGSLTVLNSTISGNQSTGDTAGVAVYRNESNLVTSFTLRNTIVSSNGARECMYQNGVSAVGSGNLIVNNFGCPGAVVSSDPQLGPLQLNAPGSTPTMAIDATSPAYNVADSTTSLAQDQRGVSRPQAIGFDIGAYEFIKPLADLAIAKTTVGEPHAGDHFSYIIDVENQGPADAQNVRITDLLPDGTVFSSITGSGNFKCSGTGPVVCVKQMMTAGEIDSLTLTILIPVSIVKGTQVKNSVSINSTTPDPNPANNFASVLAPIQ